MADVIDKVLKMLEDGILRVEKKVDYNNAITQKVSEKMDDAIKHFDKKLEEHETKFHSDWETCKECIYVFKNKKWIIYVFTGLIVSTGYLLFLHGILVPEVILKLLKIFI